MTRGPQRPAPVDAGLLLLAVFLILAVGIGLQQSIARSDSPISPAKQAFLNRLSNPPTPGPGFQNGETAAPGYATHHETPTIWPAAIYEGSLAPYPAGEYELTNHWQGNIAGNSIAVYAGQFGYETPDEGRGVLVVVADSPETGPLADWGGAFPAPIGVGKLKIAAFEGSLLTIQAKTGETLYYDAAAATFSDSWGTVLPRITARASPTPYPTPEGTLPFQLPFPTDTASQQATTVAPVPSAAGAH